MMKYFFAFACFAAAAVLPLTSSAREIVVRKKAQANPTVTFSGENLSADLDKDIKRFLAVCGWFDPVQPGKEPDYTLKASGNGSTVDIHVFQGSHRITGWRFNASGQSRANAKVIVDTILKKLFEDLDVEGFCRSRIAFCAQTRPGIRNIFLRHRRRQYGTDHQLQHAQCRAVLEPER